MIDPDGRRPLSLTEARTVQSFRLERAGFYQIRFANGRDAVIGVNPDRRESDLEPLAEDVQQLWSGSSQGARIADGLRSAGGSDISGRKPVVVRYAACVAGRASRDGFRQRLHGHAAGGSMSNHSELNSYIAKLQKRLRLGAWLRGAAIFAGTALVVTVVLVLAAQSFCVSGAWRHRGTTDHLRCTCRGRGVRHRRAIGSGDHRSGRCATPKPRIPTWSSG